MKTEPVAPPESFSEVNNLFRKGQTKVYAKNETIPEGAYYQILSGHVGLYEKEGKEHRKLLFIFGPPEIFPYPNQRLRRESGNLLAFCALDTVQVKVVKKSDFERQLIKNIQLCHEFGSLLAERLNLAYERISDLENVAVADRLKRRLIFFAKRFGVVGQHRVVIDVPLTYTDIALSIGTTRETVNRIMRQFQKEGVLKVIDRKIVFPRSIIDS